jgi:hypothetical protein
VRGGGGKIINKIYGLQYRAVGDSLSGELLAMLSFHSILTTHRHKSVICRFHHTTRQGTTKGFELITALPWCGQKFKIYLPFKFVKLPKIFNKSQTLNWFIKQALVFNGSVKCSRVKIIVSERRTKFSNLQCSDSADDRREEWTTADWGGGEDFQLKHFAVVSILSVCPHCATLICALFRVNAAVTNYSSNFTEKLHLYGNLLNNCALLSFDGLIASFPLSFTHSPTRTRLQSRFPFFKLMRKEDFSAANAWIIFCRMELRKIVKRKIRMRFFHSLNASPSEWVGEREHLIDSQTSVVISC